MLSYQRARMNRAPTGSCDQQGCKKVFDIHPCNAAVAPTFGQQGCKEVQKKMMLPHPDYFGG